MTVHSRHKARRFSAFIIYKTAFIVKENPNLQAEKIPGKMERKTLQIKRNYAILFAISSVTGLERFVRVSQAGSERVRLLRALPAEAGAFDREPQT